MKRVKKSNHSAPINEWVSVVAPLAIDVAYEIAAKYTRAGLSDITPEEKWGIFSRKYENEIIDAQNIFFRVMKEDTEAMDPAFFSDNEVRRLVKASLEESYKLDNIGNGSLVDLIFENSIRYAQGGLSDKNKLTTSQVVFSWNGRDSRYGYPDPDDKYFKRKSEIASSNYWILDGYENLGSVQFPGDPFTYEDTGDGELMVISAPEIYKKSIGSKFSLDKFEEREEQKSEETGTEETEAEEAEKDREVQKQDLNTQNGKELFHPDFMNTEAESMSSSFKQALEEFDENKKNEIMSSLQTYAMSEGYRMPAYSWLMASKIGPENLTRKIIRKINAKIGPHISAKCRSRKAMIMITVAGYIAKAGVESSRAVQALKDPITDVLNFKLPGPESKKFKDAVSSEIERVSLEMKNIIEERFGPIIASDTEDLDSPGSIIDDMFGGRDHCGKSIENPDGTQTGRRYDSADRAPSSPSPSTDYDTKISGRPAAVIDAKMGALN